MFAAERFRFCGEPACGTGVPIACKGSRAHSATAPAAFHMSPTLEKRAQENPWQDGKTTSKLLLIQTSCGSGSRQMSLRKRDKRRAVAKLDNDFKTGADPNYLLLTMDTNGPGEKRHMETRG
ncbi:hypothetical protein EVAR_93825_1 [Eumeta japonica]|uniref:Uncharacterized protein n=1 Tax=Eumeta variegata TaxID=151549 RepID=A0A4C1TWJ4_EUMVA|nr:hypothetical protein EVAR_93825_1 [Eumeta japonica]